MVSSISSEKVSLRGSEEDFEVLNVNALDKRVQESISDVKLHHCDIKPCGAPDYICAIPD